MLLQTCNALSTRLMRLRVASDADHSVAAVFCAVVVSAHHILGQDDTPLLQHAGMVGAPALT